MQISLSGEKSIDNILKHLPEAVSHQVMGAAHYAAARPLVDREHLLSPVGNTGKLADSIVAQKVSIKRATDVGEVRVGPTARHAHLVSKGTRRRTTRRGANRGVMPKNPYLEKAFSQTKDQVISGIRPAVAQSLLRTMRRYNNGR